MRGGTEAAIGAGAFALAAAAASQGVPRWDASGFQAMNGLDDRLQYVLWMPMQVGALAAPLIIGTTLALRGNRQRGMVMAMSGIAAWAAAKVAKKAVGRARPGDALEATLRIGSADTGLGFPSGHAAVATTIAVTAWRAPSPVQASLVVLPVVVGFSRVYVGAHYPLDVVGGVALGLVVAPVVDAVMRSLPLAQDGSS